LRRRQHWRVAERNLAGQQLSERPLADAQAALDQLRAGQVIGRLVLTN